MDYIYGKNVIEEFAKANMLQEVYILQSFNDTRILKAIKDNNVKVNYVDKNFLDRITASNKHQGVIGLVKEYKYATLDEIILAGKKVKRPLIVMLDGIEDPQNLGAIIRTCEAFSVTGIIIPKNRSASVNATVAKVSTGALANVKIARVTNLTSAITTLKQNSYWVYAAEANNSVSYNELTYDSPTLLIVGSEGFGISRLVKEQADYNIKIDMSGKVNSLNVSVATAILISFLSLNK